MEELTWDGHTIAQAVTRLPVIAEARVRARVRPYGICGGQTGTGAGFFSEFFGFPCQYHSTMALHAHISHGGRTINPLMAAVQRHSHTPWTWNNNSGVESYIVRSFII
jgi:hypothetical protein